MATGDLPSLFRQAIYEEGDTATSIVGVAILAEGATNTLQALQLDASKHLQVDIAADSVGIGGGTQYTEDVATANPIVGNAMMMERDDQLSTVTPVAGDWIAARGSSEGALWVAIADGSGDPITSFGGGTQYAVDDVAGATNTGTLALVVRDDSLTTLTPADGDYTQLRVSSTGALHVTGGGGGTQYTEDVATANPIVGTATMMERDDALGGLTPAEGDWAGLRCDANGALWTHDDALDAVIDGAYLNVNANIAGTDMVGGAGAVAGGVLRTTLASDDPAVTALELLDNAVDGAYLNVNSNIAGTDMVGGAGAVAAGVQRVTLASDDPAVTALELLDNAVDGAYLNVNANIAGTDMVGGAGAVAAGVLRTTLASDDPAVTALELLDNAVDGNYLNVNMNLAGTDAQAGEGTISASTQRVTLATDDDGVAHLATIAGDTTAIQTAAEIIDDWDEVHDAAAGTDGPLSIGTAYTTALPAAVANADAVRIITDTAGRLLSGVMPQNFQATITSADATSATAVKAKTGSRKMYILALTCSTDTAMSMQFQDDTGPTVLIEQLYLAANGGAHLTWPPEAPLVVNTNEDFDVITSASGNISVTITGYLAV